MEALVVEHGCMSFFDGRVAEVGLLKEQVSAARDDWLHMWQQIARRGRYSDAMFGAH